MSGTVIHSKDLREKPYFEIAGIPGRLYLESFAFGDLTPLDHLAPGGMDLRSQERSPLTLFPDRNKQGLLLSNLDKFRSDHVMYAVAEQIGSCSIGAEWRKDGRIVSTTIYLFFKCDFSLLRLFGVGNEFRIEFGFHQRTGTFLTTRSW